DQSHWYRAHGEQRYGKGHHENRMSGYIAAHCMNVIRDTYGVKMRRKWKGVVATQTVDPNVTNRFLAGVKDYIREHAPSLMISDLFDDLAVDGRSGPGYLNRISASIGGASAGVKLPSGRAAA